MTLLHQSDQIQNLLTTTCGYFCLYFLNEMSKGRSYYDFLKCLIVITPWRMKNTLKIILKLSNPIIYETILQIL